MAKTLADIKTSVNQLAQRAKLGHIDGKLTILVLNDVVNYLAAQVPTTQPVALAPETPAPIAAVTAVEEIKPKTRKKRGATTDTQTPAVPAVTVGSAAPSPTAVEPSEGVNAPVAEQSPTTSGNSRTLPLNNKVGRGITVGTKSSINTGVTVGSHPANPAGNITVGGRPRKA